MNDPLANSHPGSYKAFSQKQNFKVNFFSLLLAVPQIIFLRHYKVFLIKLNVLYRQVLVQNQQWKHQSNV